MATRKRRDAEDRPIGVSQDNDTPAGQSTSVHSRDGSIHARDGSEQPRLDEMAHHEHGRSASPAADQPAREREIGQFTGEGQPSQQKK
ncbi:MAG TPA: hypothetical protein VHB98_19595 [Chloroflexota bacterium]|nr:hypothetical protein [Chloroflexota bacterium]